MTTLTNIAPLASGNEVIANGNFAAVAPAGMFGIYSNIGLTLVLFGGVMRANGALTTIGTLTGDLLLVTLTLTDNATNYVEFASDGTVSGNTAGFTAGRTPLYTDVTLAGVQTTITDQRVLFQPVYSRLSKSVAGGAATFTLTEAEARNKVIELTGAITGAINVVLPNNADPVTVYNGTSGAFSLTVKTASGSGIAIATGKRAILYANGTDVVRVTADT